VAVKIRLKRMGKIRAPYYRIVVADSRTKRDGRVIEEIGKYHPKEEPSVMEVKSERVQYWLGVGAQPTEAVEAILKVTGDWQRFKGVDGAEGTLKVRETPKSKQDIFNEILKEKGDEPRSEAVTKRTAKKAAAADAPAAEVPSATEVPGAETPAGAIAEAEAAEPAEVAADVAASKAGGEPPTNSSGEPVEG
jgi:small subunit ribosomal protein S16